MPDIENSKIVVIGGAGFIGSHIIDLLLDEPVREVVVLDNFVRGRRENLAVAVHDSRLTVVEGDIRDSALLADTIAEADYVFLLAALWLYECVHEPQKAIDVNINGTYNVIDACRKAGIRKLVFSSSASVYGDAAEIPMTESHPFHNRTMYGATKIAGEQMLRAVYEQHGMDYVGLRYMNVYGPRMDYRGAYVSVIMKALDRIEAGQPPIIFGDGSQSYDFIHVRDVARANILALKADTTDTYYNVGSGTATTINELVSHLLEIKGSALQPEYQPQTEMFVTHRIGSTDKAAQELDFTARIPLREGLEEVVVWRIADQTHSAMMP